MAILFGERVLAFLEDLAMNDDTLLILIEFISNRSRLYCDVLCPSK